MPGFSSQCIERSVIQQPWSHKASLLSDEVEVARVSVLVWICVVFLFFGQRRLEKPWDPWHRADLLQSCRLVSRKLGQLTHPAEHR